MYLRMHAIMYVFIMLICIMVVCMFVCIDGWIYAVCKYVYLLTVYKIYAFI